MRLLLWVKGVIRHVMGIFRRRIIPRKLKRLPVQSPAFHEVIKIVIERKCSVIFVVGYRILGICQNIEFQTQSLDGKRLAGVTSIRPSTVSASRGQKSSIKSFLKQRSCIIEELNCMTLDSINMSLT